MASDPEIQQQTTFGKAATAGKIEGFDGRNDRCTGSCRRFQVFRQTQHRSLRRLRFQSRMSSGLSFPSMSCGIGSLELRLQRISPRSKRSGVKRSLGFRFLSLLLEK